MNLQSETIDQIVPALIKARGSFKAAVKDAKNPHFKSAYVTLDGVVDSINGALLSNGIFCTQQTDVADGRTVLHTRFLHASGQWIGSAYPVHPVKNDPQGEGSALTYARRYALMALAGIAPEDDDGEAATKASNRVEYVDAAQVNTLRDWINATESDVAAFCKAFKIEAVDKLLAKDYARAITMFEAKQKKAAA